MNPVGGLTMQRLYPLAHCTCRVAEVLLRVVPVAWFSWRVQGVTRLRLCVKGLGCVGFETGRRHAAQRCELKESRELFTTAQPLGFAQRQPLHVAPFSRARTAIGRFRVCCMDSH